ncbi:hypothetical protein C8R47DRAFT_1189697 [Mycena vitilis]|nr:hypothetical protein C8R47DRAFT_1189697 [Mycena vitilis]
MSFFLPVAALLSLFASFTPASGAIIIVPASGHNGLSNTARIVIIVVCVVVFVLLLACRIARIRQNNRQTLAANGGGAPGTIQMAPAANYAGQGPGGYNGYTLPSTQARYSTPQGQGYPQQQQGYPQAQQQNYPPNVNAYTPPAYTPGPGGDAEKNGHAWQEQSASHMGAPGYYAPPQGPPPSGYDAAPPAAPPAAHTTGQDHFRPQ